jgi:CBS-domain-containing membrane protein
VDRTLRSHAEAEQNLRNAGYSQEQIEDVLRDVPDPFDIDRDAEALLKHGVTLGALTDRMGGSP